MRYFINDPSKLNIHEKLIPNSSVWLAIRPHLCDRRCGTEFVQSIEKHVLVCVKKWADRPSGLARMKFPWPATGYQATRLFSSTGFDVIKQGNKLVCSCMWRYGKKGAWMRDELKNANNPWTALDEDSDIYWITSYLQIYQKTSVFWTMKPSNISLSIPLQRASTFGNFSSPQKEYSGTVYPLIENAWNKKLKTTWLMYSGLSHSDGKEESVHSVEHRFDVLGTQNGMGQISSKVSDGRIFSETFNINCHWSYI